MSTAPDTIAAFDQANAKRLAMSCLLSATSELNTQDVDLEKAYEWAEKAVAPTPPDMSLVYGSVLLSMASLLIAKLEMRDQEPEIETAYACMQKYLDHLVNLRKLEAIPSTEEAV
ncbi:hypothetical protein [Rhodoferax sp.]|uniref:hypothetical protein n=1 Tax=Rhodoferax sp. TaxID=50421 RepID=UPI0025CC69F1|nr:hypothetical protein [Rhodoferax sp.]